MRTIPRDPRMTAILEAMISATEPSNGKSPFDFVSDEGGKPTILTSGQFGLAELARELGGQGFSWGRSEREEDDPEIISAARPFQPGKSGDEMRRIAARLKTLVQKPTKELLFDGIIRERLHASVNAAVAWGLTTADKFAGHP